VSTYKALVDLSVAKAGETFEADDESVAPALAFELAEPVDDADDEPKPKRTTARKKAS
jgi:hypothetical protein